MVDRYPNSLVKLIRDNLHALTGANSDLDQLLFVGFSTYRGTVTAASDWDAPAERKRVLPALKESYEALFHDVGIPRFLILLRNRDALGSALRDPRLERAIGVIYRPETERQSHYFYARLPEQFDAVLHFEKSGP